MAKFCKDRRKGTFIRAVAKKKKKWLVRYLSFIFYGTSNLVQSRETVTRPS